MASKAKETKLISEIKVESRWKEVAASPAKRVAIATHESLEVRIEVSQYTKDTDNETLAKYLMIQAVYELLN